MSSQSSTRLKSLLSQCQGSEGYELGKEKICLVTSNSGMTKVGKYMGLSTQGGKSFLVFEDISGCRFLINPSYTELIDELETGDADQDRTEHKGEDSGVARRDESLSSILS